MNVQTAFFRTGSLLIICFILTLYTSGQQTNKTFIEKSNEYLHSNFDSCFTNAEKAYLLGSETKNDTLRAKGLLMMGNAKLIWHRDMSSIDSLSQEGIRIARSIPDSVLLTKLLNLYASILLDSGEMGLSLEVREEQLDVARRIDSPFLTQLALAGISNYYYQVKDFEKALEFRLESLELIEGNPELEDQLGIAYNNTSLNYAYLGQLDKSLEYINKAIDIHEKYKNQKSLATAYNSKGECLLYMGDTLQAIESLEMSIAISEKNELGKRLGSSAYTLAKIYAYRGKYSKAIEVAENGLAWSEKAESPFVSSNLHQLLAEINEKANNAQGVLSHYRAYTAIQDSLLEVTKEKTRLALEESFEAKEREYQIDILEQEAHVDSLKLKLSLLGATLLLIALIGLWLNIRSIRAKSKLEKQIAESEKKRLEEEIGYKNRELNGHALSIIHKNQLVAKLSEKIDDALKSEAINPAELVTLKHSLKELQRTDQDWEKFNKVFSEANPRFVSALQERNPKITSNELKQATLIKMGLSLKESASLLDIAPESVKMGRNRLKKKLDLGAEEDLGEFIQSIAS